MSPDCDVQLAKKVQASAFSTTINIFFLHRPILRIMKAFQAPSIAVLASLLLLLASATFAQINSLTIDNTRGLSFGSFVAGAGGTVAMSAGSERSATGSVVLLPSQNGQSAQFTVQGDSSATYTIDLPADSTVVLSGSGADMALTNFSSAPSGAGGQLDLTGSQVLSVGASLQVGGNQVSGSYSGSFNVTVNYN